MSVGFSLWFNNEQQHPSSGIGGCGYGGGLFIDQTTVPTSFLHLISLHQPKKNNNSSITLFSSFSIKPFIFGVHKRGKEKNTTHHYHHHHHHHHHRVATPEASGSLFLSVSLQNGNGSSCGGVVEVSNGENIASVAEEEEEEELVVVKGRLRPGRGGAMNTTKHLWAGAIAAMVSRTCVAPLERLKLEYIVRGEQSHLFDLVSKIATTQGLRGFWKGNLINILRTAPFKAINFCAYDTYRKQLLRFSGNKETTNFERFIAGAAAGVTATILCLPLDTIRTKIVAPGGEALGGVIGAFRFLVQTEGFFSLYKGLVPSIASMAPSGAVFYGVYDILKSAYLHSPEGWKRIQKMKREGQDLNAFDKLELGPIRTLLYGAISGACAEAATYPFEVVRRQLQLQNQSTRLSALATCMKIVEQGGVPALYAGLIPSLLQVLPSAAISYFVYECMKIILKVE